MDREKLSAACATIEDLFTEREGTKLADNDWRYNGQTFGERAEGHVMGILESLADEIENPDADDDGEPYLIRAAFVIKDDGGRRQLSERAREHLSEFSPATE